ncbi:hypothetical protein J7J26_04120 [Candidatus Micrarchaeota archaeon]|nr:hypothetical protein [Candidatus Micrarchaeota archaeon]
MYMNLTWLKRNELETIQDLTAKLSRLGFETAIHNINNEVIMKIDRINHDDKFNGLEKIEF